MYAKTNTVGIIAIVLVSFTIVAKSIYNAEIIEIMKAFDVSKSVAGYATTAYYLTYGFMQLVIAKILPKINLRKFSSPWAGMSGDNVI